MVMKHKGTVRMPYAVPVEVHMAIRLRAIKRGMKTGDVVAEAIKQVLGPEVAEALAVLNQAK